MTVRLLINKKNILTALFIFSFLICFSQIKTDTFSVFIINEILVKGNNSTKEKIIIRELTFSQGDTLQSSQLNNIFEKSKQNLLNTSLFNFVTIEYFAEYSNYLSVYILVEERWYIWPNPIFEYADRNFSTFIHNKNWNKINYGMFLSHNNFRGRKEKLDLKFRLGYKEQFAIYYEKPNLDKDHKHGLIADISYFRKHESDIKTLNNDVEYFDYEKKYLWKLLGIKMSYLFRPQYYNTSKFTIQYNSNSIHDTIAILNPNYLGEGKTNQQLLSFGYQFIRDKRDSKVYPLTGYYFDFYFMQDGFKILDNFTTTIFKNVFSFHDQLSKSFFYSSGVKWSHSTNKYLPYHKNYALGYSDFLHGLEYYVIDGPTYILSKNNLKYQLLAPRTEILKYIPFKKFNKVHYAMYLNLFFDMGYVNDENQLQQINSLVNKFLYSFGIGYDFVTYYDQTLRLEYSFNQLGEHGFFFHFGAPIIGKN